VALPGTNFNITKFVMSDIILIFISNLNSVIQFVSSDAITLLVITWVV